MINIDSITRKNVRELTPYRSARDEFKGEAKIWLDANENPYESTTNRYPDAYQLELKKVVSKIKGVQTNQIFIGNGSDEAIDLLFRAFCEPKVDKAYIFPPTYGMYDVSAKINNVDIVRLQLDKDFQLPKINGLLPKIKSKGLLFICSPNNPTGTVYPLKKIKDIAAHFYGLVVVDEAYIDFSETESATTVLDHIPNLVIIQTFSKAYGMAGLRLGIAFASYRIIEVMNKIKAPYNVNSLSQLKAIEFLKDTDKIHQQITEIKIEKDRLMKTLQELKSVKKVYVSQANFILAIFKNPDDVFKKLQSQGIIIRNRTEQIPGALRISIGTPLQNKTLIRTLKTI